MERAEQSQCKLLPKGCYEGARIDTDQRDQETSPKCKRTVNQHGDLHRKVVTSVIKAETGVHKLTSSSVLESLVHRRDSDKVGSVLRDNAPGNKKKAVFEEWMKIESIAAEKWQLQKLAAP